MTMQQIQIVPKYINQPRQAHWKDGSIKDQQGTLWSVDKNALGMFQQNAPVMIGYEPAGGQRKYPQIVMVNGQPIGQQPVAGSFQQVGQAAPPIPQTGYQPQPQQPYQASPQQPIATTIPMQPCAPHQPQLCGASKECGMFVMSIMGKAFQGQATIPELQDCKVVRNIIYNLKLAWEIEMEGRPEPQRPGQNPAQGNAAGGPPAGHPAGDAPFNDEIPM